MKTVQFGMGMKFGNGDAGAVAFGADGTALEFHQNEGGDTLWTQRGQIVGAQLVAWQDAERYDDGRWPSIAGRGGQLLDLHCGRGTDYLYDHVGSLDSGGLRWYGSSATSLEEQGAHPRVAMNDSAVIQVHRAQGSGRSLWVRVGVRQGSTVSWPAQSVQFDTSPDEGGLNVCSVAMDGAGNVILAWVNADRRLRYAVGRVSAGALQLGAAQSVPGLDQWAMADVDLGLADNGTVVLVFGSGTHSGYAHVVSESQSYCLWSLTGLLHAGSVQWDSVSGAAAPSMFSVGRYPSVAVAEDHALVVFRGPDDSIKGTESDRYYSLSPFCDRSRWMSDRRSLLAGRTLKQICLPGAHDAALYTGADDPNFIDPLKSKVGRAQDVSFYSQLRNGVRWFDLRIKVRDGVLTTHHGIAWGPPAQTVLADVKRFFAEGNAELAVLAMDVECKDRTGKDGDLTWTDYKALQDLIRQELGAYLYTGPISGRLWDTPFGTLVGAHGAVLVMCDDVFARPVTGSGEKPTVPAMPGVFSYDGSGTADAAGADVRILDSFADTVTYDRMVSHHQSTFGAYTGDIAPGVSADLYLMSWTMTPDNEHGQADILYYCKPANSYLPRDISSIPIPNSHGQLVNVLLTDFAETSNVVDVCIALNDRYLTI